MENYLKDWDNYVLSTFKELLKEENGNYAEDWGTDVLSTHQDVLLQSDMHIDYMNINNIKQIIGCY